MDNVKTIEDINRWNAKLDVYRPTTEFSDLLKIVACYYEQYSRASTFLGPWIAKQFGNTMFFAPSKEQLETALGTQRPAISFRARTAFIDAIISYLSKNKGKKTLITPSPSSHHSAQFPSGTFEISEVKEAHPRLRDDKMIRKEVRTLHKIEFANAQEPVYVENLVIPPDQISFIILRPKLGKLGTASANRWEALFYKRHHGYIVEHVDSHLNPRWSGLM
jgi:hypothetical protein